MKNTQIAILKAKEKGYTIDRSGIVTGVRGRTMSQRRDGSGYFSFTVRFDGSRHEVSFHRYQAYEKFGNTIFNKETVVRHLNGIQTDNSWENIDIGSYSQNCADIPKQTKSAMSVKANRDKRKLSMEQARKLRSDRNEGLTYSELNDKYNIAVGTIWKILKNNTYKEQK